MFPAPKGRNDRHYQRQHLSGMLVTFRKQLAAEFASRNCTYTAVCALHGSAMFALKSLTFRILKGFRTRVPIIPCRGSIRKRTLWHVHKQQRRVPTPPRSQDACQNARSVCKIGRCYCLARSPSEARQCRGLVSRRQMCRTNTDIRHPPQTINTSLAALMSAQLLPRTVPGNSATPGKRAGRQCGRHNGFDGAGAASGRVPGRRELVWSFRYVRVG